MILELNNKSYDIDIIYKNNKNMYLRIKDNLKIVVTAPKGTSLSFIKKFINSNIDYINKVIQKKESIKDKKTGKFEYMGKLYDKCMINDKSIYFGDSRVFIGTEVNIDTWYRKRAEEVFTNCYEECFSKFKESKTKSVLKIRKMTSKWGVCNITNNTITLNLELIKYDYKYLNYVIFHELCHLKHHDHSKKFWSLVETYVPDYKNIKKEMKNL